VSGFNVGQIASEKGNTHKLAYWITKFREFMSSRLNEAKPKHNIPSKPTTPYKKALNKFVPVIHNIFENKLSGTQLYILELTIDCETLRTKHNVPILHYFNRKGQKREVIRLIDNNYNPTTQPIK
jgi:hypothetical protein